MQQRMPGRVTLDGVARAAGVSRSTASRVLGEYGSVSAQAREQVTGAARRLGYIPDPAARALASGGGTHLAVVVNGRSAEVLRDPYVGRVVAAAAEAGMPHQVGVSLTWLPADDPGKLRRLADDRSLHGAILVNTTYAVLAAVPEGLNGRVVSIGVGSADVPSFDVDNGAGATEVIHHLLSTGRRRIGMITGPDWLPCAQRALDAYRTAMCEAGLPTHTIAGDFTVGRGRTATREMVARWPDTDAVFALSDLAALGALTTLHGIRADVPGDIAVAGFDDIAFASLSDPPLTTASHPVEQIAAHAASALLKGLAAPPTTLFPSTLVRRNSA